VNLANARQGREIGVKIGCGYGLDGQRTGWQGALVRPCRGMAVECGRRMARAAGGAAGEMILVKGRSVFYHFDIIITEFRQNVNGRTAQGVATYEGCYG